MEIVRWHEARQVPSWLIFDVGQNMRATLFFLIPVLCGCQPSPRNEIHFHLPGATSGFEIAIEDQIAALAAADPLDDAVRAYRRGDYHLAGFLGIGLMIPGVNFEFSKLLPGPQNYLPTKIISGTSDMLSSERHGVLNDYAFEYAKAYNAQMIVLLTTKGKTPNKAPEPTPGAVTPRATSGASK